MIDWTGIVGFAWDQGNALKSTQKHGVSCREAEELFQNSPLLVLPDPQHSKKEERFHALGRTEQGRLLHIAFTVRETKLRVISARPMSRKERNIYESQS
jgi:uncharacterized DUF497 family protein